jgi:hypothetical protein
MSEDKLSSINGNSSLEKGEVIETVAVVIAGEEYVTIILFSSPNSTDSL